MFVVFSQVSQAETVAVVGVYEYVYEYSSEELSENHYIVLEQINDKLVGRYYGTSDDFDDAREGYLPGFYVAEIKDLKISGNNINFKLDVIESDFFVNRISLNIKSAEDVNTKINPFWISDSRAGISLSKKQLVLSGNIMNGNIVFDIDSDKRLFNRMKNS